MAVFATFRVVVAAPIVPAAASRVAVTAVEVSVAASGVPIAASIIAVVAPGIAVATTVVAAVVIAPIIPATAAIVTVCATAIVAAVPRAGTDKDIADKVVRTVEAIWSAFVGVVVVVSVRANGSCADVVVARADSNFNGNLSLCITCAEHENAE